MPDIRKISDDRTCTPERMAEAKDAMFPPMLPTKRRPAVQRPFVRPRRLFENEHAEGWSCGVPDFLTSRSPSGRRCSPELPVRSLAKETPWWSTVYSITTPTSSPARSSSCPRLPSASTPHQQGSKRSPVTLLLSPSALARPDNDASSPPGHFMRTARMLPNDDRYQAVVKRLLGGGLSVKPKKVPPKRPCHGCSSPQSPFSLLGILNVAECDISQNVQAKPLTKTPPTTPPSLPPTSPPTSPPTLPKTLWDNASHKLPARVPKQKPMIKNKGPPTKITSRLNQSRPPPRRPRRPRSPGIVAVNAAATGAIPIPFLATSPWASGRRFSGSRVAKNFVGEKSKGGAPPITVDEMSPSAKEVWTSQSRIKVEVSRPSLDLAGHACGRWPSSRHISL